MERKKTLELIMFDCDGVLVDSEPLSLRAHQSLFAGPEPTPSAELWARCFGHRQDEIFEMIETATGRSTAPELRAELWPRTKALFAAELKPTPGLVAFLAANDVPRCVASSSGPERLRFCLEVAGLTRFFDGRIFSAYGLARGKPAPDIFLHAAEKMGVAPEAALAIEDSLPGVVAARAAGATVIGYVGGSHVGEGHGRKLVEAGAHAVAASWEAVAALIDGPRRLDL